MRTIETERLTLREVRESDTQTIFERWASDPEVTRYMTWNPHRSIEDTRMVMDYWLSEYGKDNTYRWVLVPRGEDKPIGIIDVVSYDDGVPVLGYCEGRKYWGQGYMTEALRAVTAEDRSGGRKQGKQPCDTEGGVCLRPERQRSDVSRQARYSYDQYIPDEKAAVILYEKTCLFTSCSSSDRCGQRFYAAKSRRAAKTAPDNV